MTAAKIMRMAITDSVSSLIGDISEDDVRQLNHKPSKLGILLKQRRNVVRIFSVRSIRSGILFKQRPNFGHIVVIPIWRFIETVTPVTRRIYDFHD